MFRPSGTNFNALAMTGLWWSLSRFSHCSMLPSSSFNTQAPTSPLTLLCTLHRLSRDMVWPKSCRWPTEAQANVHSNWKKPWLQFWQHFWILPLTSCQWHISPYTSLKVNFLVWWPWLPFSLSKAHLTQLFLFHIHHLAIWDDNGQNPLSKITPDFLSIFNTGFGSYYWCT